MLIALYSMKLIVETVYAHFVYNHHIWSLSLFFVVDKFAMASDFLQATLFFFFFIVSYIRRWFGCIFYLIMPMHRNIIVSSHRHDQPSLITVSIYYKRKWGGDKNDFRMVCTFRLAGRYRKRLTIDRRTTPSPSSTHPPGWNCVYATWLH